MRRHWIAATLFFVSGCRSMPAAVVTPGPDPALLARAGSRVLDGCYDCLLEARDLYEKAAAGSGRPRVLPDLFEVQILLVLREKELAIDPSASMARARSLAAELPPSAGAGRYLTIAEAVWSDAAGWPRRRLQPFRRAHAEFIARIDEEIDRVGATLFSEPFRQYVALTLDCLQREPYGQRSDSRTVLAESVGATAPPLVVYRAATCMRLREPPLTAILARVPGFVEINYFLGWAAILTIQQDGGLAAVRLSESAHERFPHSPAVTYLAGIVRQLLGDCREALRFFDETIALEELHEGGALGRTVCLSFLKEREPAIASATRMITLGMDNSDDAHYWRAWNRHAIGQLAEARTDIDMAKRRRSTPEFHTLAGVIEHDQGDLQAADRDLKLALSMSGGSTNCIAASYYGLVHIKLDHAAVAAASLDNASECYRRQRARDAQALTALEANADLDDVTKAARTERFKAAIAESEKMARWAAMNGAVAFASARDFAAVERLLNVVGNDSEFADEIADLRAYLAQQQPAR